MKHLREVSPSNLGKYKILRIDDYLKPKSEEFTKSNVLKFIFDDSSFIAIRPSGTEPKYKNVDGGVAKYLKENLLNRK